MSNWDFGYGREPADPRDPQSPRPPGGAGGPRRPRGPRGRGDAGWPGAAGYPDAEGWPSRDGAPYDPQAAPYPLTYERDDFDQRPTGPWQAGPRRAPRPTSPGRAVPQRPAPGQTGTWQTAPPPSATQRRGYVSGQPGYAPDGYAPDSFEPWSAGYSSGALGNRGGTGTRPPLYPDRQADEEPWREDSRGPRLDGPWWDPDSWPDWRRWLIPVGVAVLAAAIGAALVLLTGLHMGASAAAGQANSTAQARPPTLPDKSGISGK